jgi:hypothetical protein
MKGDTLDEDKPIRHEFYRIVPLTSSLVFEDEIYESFADVAPDYSTGICVPFRNLLDTDADTSP